MDKGILHHLLPSIQLCPPHRISGLCSSIFEKTSTWTCLSGVRVIKKKMFLKLCVSPKLFKRHFVTTLDLESYQFRCREMKFLALEANAGSGFPVWAPSLPQEALEASSQLLGFPQRQLDWTNLTTQTWNWMRGRGTRKDRNSGCLSQAWGIASGSPASQRKDSLSTLTPQLEASYTSGRDGRLKGQRGGQIDNKAAGRAPGRDRRAPLEVKATNSSLVPKSLFPPRGQDSWIPAGVQQQPRTPADQEQTVCSGCLTDHPRCCCADRARERSFSPLD